MIFLTTNDILANISSEQIDAAIKGDATRYDRAEAYALALIRSNIGGKYNCDTVFAQTGSSRHPLILEFAISIVIWHLLSNGLNPRNLPEVRKENHDQAISLLGKMANDKSNPNLPLLTSEAKSVRVKLGGSKKVSYRW